MVDADPKIGELIDSLRGSRDSLSGDIESVLAVRDHLISMFPDKPDFRNKHAYEDKLKTMSSIYSCLLNLRQEYNKTIINEIDIRRRLSGEKKENIVDIRKLAEDIDRHMKENKPKNNESEQTV